MRSLPTPVLLNLLKDEQASGDTGRAGELVAELLFPFTIGSDDGSVVDDGSSIVPSKTVVVPSVLCTKMGGAGAETRLRGPSSNSLLPLREFIPFLFIAMLVTLLHGFINDWMNRSASPAVPNTCKLSSELDCFIPPNGNG